MLTIHQGEVLGAQLALQKAQSQDVKTFAQHMIEEHQEAIARVQAMVPGSQPGGDATSAALAREASVVLADLNALPAEQFDLAYMTVQISAHAKALGLTEVAIVPSVQAIAGTSSDGAGASSRDTAGRNTGGTAGGSTGAAGGNTSGSAATGATGAAGAAGASGGGAASNMDGRALQAELGTFRGAVVRHLTEALQIQQRLRGAPSDPSTRGAGAPNG